MVKNTFVINPIRTEYIERCLYTLYMYTDMSNSKVVVVDQTLNGLPDLKGVHLKLRPHRNLGFSKSMNEGIIHGLRWGSEYITCLNDDVEFINKEWWLGIKNTFNMDEKILAVNPMSIREPGWGYGLEHGKYIDLLPYKEMYTEEDYNYLLEGDFKKAKEKIIESNLLNEKQKEEWRKGRGIPIKKVGVIDGIATWCTVFKREHFEKIGLFEEKYYPGGGEDYDMDARCYRKGYRMVGTTFSWAWHWWGSSKDKQGEMKEKSLPIIKELKWMNPDELWPPDKNNGQKMDPWGKITLEDGTKKPMYRDPKINIIDI